MNDLVIAIDLGGTNLRTSAVDREGRILWRTKRETPRSDTPNAILSMILDGAKQFLNSASENDGHRAIALAVPGTVNSLAGIIMNTPNLRELNGFPISMALESELGLPCILENDANAAAIGEHWNGASKGSNDSICITLGTGVGGGIIKDGEIVRGVDGTAGEIGHICVEPFGEQCGCGSRGCLEQYASASAVVRLAIELSPKFSKTTIDFDSHLSSEQIFDAGRKGDELALEVFRIQGFYLGLGISGLINLLNPDVIVIGGGAAAGWELFMPETERIVRERTYREPRERVKIVRAEKGDDAGVLGVAHLAFETVSALA